MDMENYMVAAFFIAAVLIFAVGLVVERRRVVMSESPLLPPMGEATWLNPPTEESPYAPPAAPSSEPLVQRLGLRFDRVPCHIYRLIDAPLMLFLIGLYMLPLLFDVFGVVQNVGTKISFEVLLGNIVTQAFMVALVIGMVVWRTNVVTWLGLRWSSWWWVFVLAPVGVLTTWAFAYGLEVVGYMTWLEGLLGIDVSKGEGQQEVVQAFTETKDSGLVALLCFTAVIVAPVSEEILFRGYLYPASKRFIGRLPAILFSALIFAAIHHNALALMPLCFLAILLAVSYEVSGSIWAPIGIHLLFNAATVGVQLANRWGWIDLSQG